MQDILSYYMDIKKSYNLNEPIWVDFSFKNNSSDFYWILTWNTPFEGIKNDFFIIYHEKSLVLYEGRMIKRSNPTEKEYLLIPPNKSISTKINIKEAYQCNKKGLYTIQFKGQIFDHLKGSKLILRSIEKLNPLHIKGNNLSFVISK